MGSLCFGPLAHERREVLAVAGDEDALLSRSQIEHLWIGYSMNGYNSCHSSGGRRFRAMASATSSR
jgi:hypothetical protein